MKVVAAIILTLAGIAVYAHWPVTPLPPQTQVDSVVIYKSARRLVLMRNGKALKAYRIALGKNPIGPKTQEGDGRTPEGSYVIDYRKSDSAFHRALHLSYPNRRDRANAAARGVSPGGQIMIHGLKNGLGFLGRLHGIVDWTRGCIAVTDPEIEQIWSAVPVGTRVVIHP